MLCAHHASTTKTCLEISKSRAKNLQELLPEVSNAVTPGLAILLGDRVAYNSEMQGTFDYAAESYAISVVHGLSTTTSSTISFDLDNG